MQDKVSERVSSAPKDIIGLFLGSRLLIGLMGYLSTLVVIKGRYNFMPRGFLDLFYRWDSLWYVSIVQNGYHFVAGKESNVAFFPLYPLLIKMLTFYTSNQKFIIVVGILLSNMVALLSCLYLYKLVRLDYSESIAFKAVLFLLIFPVSFFFSIVYTEGLFIFLIISCFYYARKKNWPVVAVLGFLLPLTRSIGVFAIIPLVFEYYDLSFADIRPTKKFVADVIKKTKSSILYLATIPLGAVSYMVYMYAKFGDPLIYIKAEEPWNTKFSTFLTAWNNSGQQQQFLMVTNRAMMILAILMTIYLIVRKVRSSYVVYSAVFLFFYFSSNNLQSIPRFVSVLFPLYLGLAIYCAKSKVRGYLVIISSVMLLMIMTILFVNGYLLT
jgi:hypothetical protein